MSIGNQIKKYRYKLGLTQSSLAERLHVTSQAVSRWENDEVEPSIDTIKDMARIFNCSIDELMDYKQDSEEEVKIENKIPDKVLAYCDECNRPITNQNDLFRVKKNKHFGRYNQTVQICLCGECNKLREKEEEKQKQIERARKLDTMRKQRIHSFIWPSIVSLTLITIAIFQFVNGSNTTGAILLSVGITAFPFISCWILFNNFVPEMWVAIALWSVRFPRIIFTLDLNGILALIFVKILFGVLSFAISLLAVAIATAISLAVSVFVYPFALVKNIRGIE